MPLADNSGIREIVIGAVVTAMATLAVWRFRRRTHDRYKLRFEYVRQAVHIPKSIIVDTWILLRVIVMRLRGKAIPARIIGVPFKIRRKRACLSRTPQPCYHVPDLDSLTPWSWAFCLTSSFCYFTR